jgi:hypothetical protein
LGQRLAGGGREGGHTKQQNQATDDQGCFSGKVPFARTSRKNRYS